jgi:membrane-associated protease RseP (regulator of RpoE activity)
MVPPAPDGWIDKGPFKNIVKEVRQESVDSIPEGKEKNAFYNLSAIQKLICMAGGILINLCFGFLLFFIALSFIGGAKPIPVVGSVENCISSCAVISPAKEIGLENGDKIIAIDGKPVNSTNDVYSLLKSTKGNSTPITISRNSKELVLSATPKGVNQDGKLSEGNDVDRYILGFTFATERERFSFSEVMDTGKTQLVGTLKLVPSIPMKIYESVKSVFTHEERGNGAMISLVGIGQVAVQETTSTNDFSSQVASVLLLLGSLNIALFVMNLLPLLPFDGGHIVNALYEASKRGIYRLRGKPRPRPADLARSMPVAYIVWGLLIVLFVVTIFVDIANPVQL